MGEMGARAKTRAKSQTTRMPVMMMVNTGDDTDNDDDDNNNDDDDDGEEASGPPGSVDANEKRLQAR